MRMCVCLHVCTCVHVRECLCLSDSAAYVCMCKCMNFFVHIEYEMINHGELKLLSVNRPLFERLLSVVWHGRATEGDSKF